jgi:hypothetical protein
MLEALCWQCRGNGSASGLVSASGTKNTRKQTINNRNRTRRRLQVARATQQTESVNENALFLQLGIVWHCLIVPTFGWPAILHNKIVMRLNNGSSKL